jgi:protein gp37
LIETKGEKIMGKTTIEWCDYSFNPWIGCTKVSEGCRNCYAATQDKFRHWTQEGFGKGRPRHRTSEDYWKNPLKWNRLSASAHDSWNIAKAEYSGEAELLARGFIKLRRPRVFCASLADWLDPEVPVEWLADLLALIYDTPHLDWLLLTKRPKLWRERVLAADAFLCERPAPGIDISAQWSPYGKMSDDWICGRPPENVWVGATVENQDNEKRITDLLNIPARVRFLSCEPLLGPVNLSRDGWLETKHEIPHWDMPTEYYTGPGGIHWVICGAESGPNRRPMDTGWARALREQCKDTGTAFFMKQIEVAGKITGDIGLFPEDLRVREFPEVNHE